MTGTDSQIEWAAMIKSQVNAEFDRVANALHEVAGRQNDQDWLATRAILVILEEKRLEVMANERAGYFIKNWQEMNGQVRQMIAQDPRYQAIKATKVDVKSRPARSEEPAAAEAKPDEQRSVSVKLTVQELELLASLASDQLFRREFIDPRMPGYKSKPGEISMGKHLVERLRGLTGRGQSKPLGRATATGATV